MQPHEIRILAGAMLICLIGQALRAAEEPKEAGKKPLPEPGRAADAKPPPDYEALIDSLANRKNRAPLLLKEIKNTVPVFFEPFDADEEVRVREVARSLVRYPGNELWPHLNAHSNDQRYALTYTEEPRSVSMIARNETVGVVCKALESQIMDYPCTKHLPKRRGKNDKQATGIPKFHIRPR